MRQISFSSAEHEGKKRVTRREKFLGEMEQVVPWSRLLGALEPYYPKGTRGRPPIGLERMLRLYFVQQWYALSDEGLEDAVSDSAAIRQFVGIDLGHEEAPDATTVLKFRPAAGSAQADCCAAGGNQRALARARADDARGDDGGRHLDQRADLDEESRQGARP